MATMEKPKQKKKKKLREVKNEETIDKEEQFERVAIEFPSTSTRCDEILSHDCFVSSEFKSISSENEDFESVPIDIDKNEGNEQDIDSTKETTISIDNIKEEIKISENLKEETTILENAVKENIEIKIPDTKSANIQLEPTAPIIKTKINRKISTPTTSNLVKYPDLTNLRHNEEKTKISYDINLKKDKCKPFTVNQLREIYFCNEIEVAKRFEMEFLMNSAEENFKNHVLYCLLMKYSKYRTKIKVNLMDLQNFKKRITTLEPNVWSMENKTIQYSGTCGDNLNVTGTEIYKVAVLHENVLESLSDSLSQLHQLICFSHTTNVVYCEVTKLKIEQLIREILSYKSFNNINSDTPIILNNTQDPSMNICVSHLRIAISILFCFIRRPSPDQIFSNDIKSWLQRLIAIQLRVATREDHWFLLFHILRCPSGISLWATPLIQIPNFHELNKPGDFLSSEINYCVSFLGILLMPIKKRNEFLSACSQAHKDISDPVKDDLWILVDSDGEEGSNSSGECVGLKESDLISFLNQVPFDVLFKSILNIEKNDENYILPEYSITGNQLIKIIAFNSSLIELFGEGLITYNTERYKQFAKRLGRLIRHTIQYISDYHKLYIRNNLSKDPYLCERIHVEFDSFVLKSCNYIYRARSLGTWQYFSSLPYTDLDLNTVWKLFYFLNVGFPTEFIFYEEDFQKLYSNSDFWYRFNAATNETTADDMYYLLQAFLGMALERDRVSDWNFIQNICSHILNIGFINQSTREICYKTSRDMLVNMLIVYPELLTNILHDIKTNLTEMENLLYLIRSLPIDKWQPTMLDYEILSNWLLNNNYDKLESILARIIISHLNWNFTINDELFISHDIHVRMACLICETLIKYVPETIGSSGISESVRQVTNLIDIQNTKEQFTLWCWTIVETLKLHSMDQSRKLIKTSLENPSKLINLIPEMEKITIIFQGVSESRPLAIYLSVLISLWGHSIPLICQKGFQQLQLLLIDYRHSTVIRCLQLITPLFLDCPETLSQCEKFQDILKTILNSDRTYIKMAKEFISSNSPGPVLELFGNMLQSQIIHYSDYNLTSPSPLINLWLECFIHIPNWQNPNVFYLIDLLLKIAYQYPETWWNCKEYLRFSYTNSDEVRQPKSSTFKMLLGSSSNPGKNLPTCTPDAGWFALINLELEHEIYELQTGLWNEFIKQLRITSGRFNMDNIIKKAASIVSCPTIQANSLVLYKYANLIASFSINHPLLPIICQKFFTLYLTRANDGTNERFYETFGVSDKFYEYNISLMKKLKSRLKQAEEYYLNESQKYSGTENEGYHYFLVTCSKLFKTYLLWLEETSLNKISRNQNIDLPPQFNIEKLKTIFDENDQHWTEFLYLPKIRKEQIDSSNEWLKNCYRYNSSKKLSTTCWPIQQETNPTERIINHLKSYDKPITPPDVIKAPLIMETFNPKEVNNVTLTTLRKDFNILDEFAKQFNFGIKEINCLNGKYKDMLRELYKNLPYSQRKYLKCSSLFSKSMLNCIKPAEVNVKMEKPQKDEPLAHQIEMNRERYEKLLEQIISQNVNKLVLSIERIEYTIRNVIIFQNESKENDKIKKQLADISIQFFFDVIKNMNENITSFPPTNDTCNILLSELGIFIQEYQETQGIRILETALKRPELIKILSELFVPSKVAPEYFINLYKFLIDSHMRRCDTKILFVLLSKFDLQNWLQNFQPKLSEISQLLKLILIGLENWNQTNTELLQDLFRRHLIHIFEHQFPEHYGEVLQTVLISVSDQKLKSEVLMDLINSLLIRCSCEKIELNTNQIKIMEQIKKFATQQNLFTFKSITDTIVLFAQHFQKERLQHGLHGLYPKHKDYILPLSILFTCFGHAAVVSAVYTYPSVLADQICDWLFAPIVEMYSPWLITYSAINLQNSTANWIKQLIANGKVLYPWSELHVDSAQVMIFAFIKTLQFILDSLPVSNSILGHVLSWYEFHFAKRDIGHHLRSPIHTALILLPWDRFQPNALNIESMYKILQEYLPECHSLLGYMFVRVSWTSWFKQIFESFNYSTQLRIISLLLKIFIQISFEPHVHDDLTASKILEESLEFPWHLIEYQGLENVLNWFVVSVEPSIVLKISSEINSIDLAVLELLKFTSCMSKSLMSSSSTIIQSKRILYVRSIVRLLKACKTKHEKLLETKEGHKAFQTVLIDLITTIEDVINSSSNNRRDVEIEAQNLMIEIVGSLQTQGEFISRLYVNAIIIWQSKCNIGSLILGATLNAIGGCKTITTAIYSLLEATIYNYFRNSNETQEYHSPSWNSVLQRLGLSFNYFNLLTLIEETYLLTLHVFILYKLKTFENLSEKITFLQDLCQLLEQVKTNEMTEPRMAIIWGAIISCGCQILKNTDNAKKPLLMLARYFQNLSSQTEGWGEGLLGVIGLKRDSVSNRRKILTRCLSCFIFSLFPDNSGEETKPSQEFITSLDELKNVSASKKYADIKLLSIKAIVIVEESKFVDSEEINEKIYNIIRLLYNENFLSTIPDVWKF